MHKFFHVFPVETLNGNDEAARRLDKIDKLLDIGRRLLKDALETTMGRFNIPRTKFREFLAFAADHRKKSKVSE